MTPNPMLAAALGAIARGLPVIPLRPGTKRNAWHGDTDEHPCPRTGVCRDGHRGWEQRAISDPDEARWYWTSRRFAGCNVGVPTGPAGRVVVDLDVPKADDKPRSHAWNLPGVRDGADVFTVVCEQAGHPVPWDTFTVATPSGGKHLWFRAPEGVQLRTTGGDRGRGLGWKVDTRAWGGYVVWAGSIVDGRAYEIVEDCGHAPLAAWLVDRLRPAPLPAAPRRPVSVATGRKARYLEAAKRGEAKRVQQAIEGERNATLYTAAFALGQLVGGGELTADDVTTELLAAAWPHVSAGAYSEQQAMATIRSWLRAGAKRSRQVA